MVRSALLLSAKPNIFTCSSEVSPSHSGASTTILMQLYRYGGHDKEARILYYVCETIRFARQSVKYRLTTAKTKLTTYPPSSSNLFHSHSQEHRPIPFSNLGGRSTPTNIQYMPLAFPVDVANGTTCTTLRQTLAMRIQESRKQHSSFMYRVRALASFLEIRA
jgi:hypothetical protein